MKSLAITELIEQFNSCSPEELVKQFGPEELRELQEQLADIEHDQLDRRCAEDPLYWAHNHTATENPINKASRHQPGALVSIPKAIPGFSV